MKCYEIKQCGMDTQTGESARCPVYISNTNCRDNDWIKFREGLEESAKKTGDMRTMLNECTGCPVREAKKTGVDAFMSKIRQL